MAACPQLAEAALQILSSLPAFTFYTIIIVTVTVMVLVVMMMTIMMHHDVDDDDDVDDDYNSSSILSHLRLHVCCIHHPLWINQSPKLAQTM